MSSLQTKPSPINVSIVPAEAVHVPAIKLIVNKAYSKYINRIGKPPAPMTADYNQLLTTHHVFILQENYTSTVLGSIVLDLEPGTDSIQINNLVVDPSTQGRGYGRVLMTHAEEYARDRGRHSLVLYTNVKMHENLGLYAKMGFRETGRKEDSGFDRVYFRKDL